MKKHIFTAAAASLLLLAACSQDELPVNDQQPDAVAGNPVTITAGIGPRPDTRIMYDVDGTITKVNWSAGAEQFSILYGGASPESYLFVKPAGAAPVASAEFTGNMPTVAVGTTLYAVYPGNATLKANEEPYMDLSQQSGTQDDLNRNHLMIAKTTVTSVEDLDNLKFDFEHKVNVLKLTLRNDDFTEGEAVSGIELEATGLSTGFYYNIFLNIPIEIDDSKITLTEAAIVNANHEVTVYITLPHSGNLTNIKIAATYDGKAYNSTLGNKLINSPGKIYTAQVDMQADAAPGDNKWACSNIVWDNVHQRLTFAATTADNASIPANSQGVLFKWGSLVAISPAPLVGTTTTYTAAQYPAGHIVYDPTDNYAYSWADIPYTDETAAPFDDDATTDDDFATYNGSTGFDATAGKGDICRYISSQPGWGSGKWRLPTGDEYGQLMDESVSNGDFAKNTIPSGEDKYHYGYFQPESGVWLGTGVTSGGSATSPTVGVYFPASGFRDANGAVDNTGFEGCGWSGSSSFTEGFAIDTGSDWVFQGGGDRQNGLPVRCVRID